MHADRPQDTPIRRAVAEMIRATGRTQKQLATDAGVAQSLVSSILTGARADLRADVVARLARACGLSATALGRLMYECVPEKESEKISGS